jgi:hypothetical protein
MTKVYNPTPEREDVPTQGHDAQQRPAPKRELALVGSEDEADFKELMAILAGPSEDGDEDDDASQCQAVDLKTYLTGFDDGEDSPDLGGHPERQGGA